MLADQVGEQTSYALPLEGNDKPRTSAETADCQSLFRRRKAWPRTTQFCLGTIILCLFIKGLMAQAGLPERGLRVC